MKDENPQEPRLKRKEEHRKPTQAENLRNGNFRFQLGWLGTRMTVAVRETRALDLKLESPLETSV